MVPVKPLSGAKSRLAPLLGESERAALVEHMLTDVLAALRASTRLAGIVVVTADDRVGEIASAGGAEVLRETRPGLNRALEQARDHLSERDAPSLLVIPGDLPLLRGDVVDVLVSAAAEPPSVVIAPDAARTGTNALLCAPPPIVDPAFGPGSFARHRQEADAAGAALAVVTQPELTLDLDEPADVGAILRAGEAREHPCRTIRYLEAIGAATRLAGLRPVAEKR